MKNRNASNHEAQKVDKKKEQETQEEGSGANPSLMKEFTKQETYENWTNWQKKLQGSFEQLIFKSIGRDTYFKRAAQRAGAENGGLWIENPMRQSYMFNVHWDYGDSKIDAKRLQQFQFCNHFPETRELTTKQGLTRNLNSITMPGVNPDSFFPRSYDLSDPKQLELFMIDFNHTSILNLIYKHADYFQKLLSFRMGEQNVLKNG